MERHVFRGSSALDAGPSWRMCIARWLLSAPPSGTPVGLELARTDSMNSWAHGPAWVAGPVYLYVSWQGTVSPPQRPHLQNKNLYCHKEDNAAKFLAPCGRPVSALPMSLPEWVGRLRSALVTHQPLARQRAGLANHVLGLQMWGNRVSVIVTVLKLLSEWECGFQ